MSSLKLSVKPAWMFISVGVLTSLFLVALYLSGSHLVTSLNYKVLDLNMADSDAPSSSELIVIVDIDEKSLNRFGQWPWPRDRVADLLQSIYDHGAASIALDIIFAEPDRTSSNMHTGTIQLESGDSGKIQLTSRTFGNHDDALAEVFAKGPYVLGYEFLFKPSGREVSKPLHPLKTVWIQKNNPDRAEPFFEALDVVNNLDLFSEAVSFSGFLNATPDTDGILRRLPLVIRFKDALYPSLSLAAFMQYKRKSTAYLLTKRDGAGYLQIDQERIPFDSNGNVWLNFQARDRDIPMVSAGDLLDGLLPENSFAHKIVLVGSSASGWKPVFQTPGDPVSSHVVIHAHMLDTLLAGAFPKRERTFLLYEAGATLLLAFLFSLFIMKAGLLSSGLLGGSAVVLLWYGSQFLFHSTGYLFSPLLPMLTIVAEYAVLTIMKTRRGQHQAEAVADNTLMLLKHSETSLDSIIRSVPDIIFRLDASGQVVFVSPAISQYKKREDELLGRPIFDLIAPEDRHKATYRVNERRTGKRATNDLELRMLLSKNDSIGAEQETRFFSVSAQGLYQFEKGGKKTFIGTQGIVRDITEQRQLKEQLLKAQKMEVVGNLAAGVAHDLNNVLSGLVSYPDLLLLELPEDSPLRDKVITIQQSGKKAAAIVQDMLTLARRGVTNKEVFSVNGVVREYFASADFEKLKEKHPNVQFRLNLNDDLFNVIGSPIHLSKALMNLVINASEAIPAGGEIVVSSCNCYLDKPVKAYEEIPEGEYARLRVQDNGVGISSEDVGRIFEPFYTKKKMGGSGTGLGMTVIWATVKDMGGYIDLDSEEGRGTLIDIYLPTTREAYSEESRKVVLEDFIGTEHILVVDDIEEQRTIAVNLLTKLGYAVSSASSGEAAFEHIKENPVDLIVLDMIMPGGMDGLDTYRKILTLYPEQKAIIASGFSESGRVKELQRLGAGRYVQKPYTLEKIGIAVRSELDRT